MIDVTLQEVDLCQHLLVVKFFQFSERDERGGVRVGVGREERVRIERGQQPEQRINKSQCFLWMFVL
jgi:hypothetical protein